MEDQAIEEWLLNLKDEEVTKLSRLFQKVCLRIRSTCCFVDDTSTSEWHVLDRYDVKVKYNV
jgi:hypothetical protein